VVVVDRDKVRGARVGERRRRLTRRQARQRQAKSKKENRYVIKVMNSEFTQGRGTGPFVREDQRLSEVRSLLIGL
jgi:hypothetical protein